MGEAIGKVKDETLVDTLGHRLTEAEVGTLAETLGERTVEALIEGRLTP